MPYYLLDVKDGVPTGAHTINPDIVAMMGCTCPRGARWRIRKSRPVRNEKRVVPYKT